MDTLLRDLAYGLRRLRQTAGFSAIAAATLALGIGATTALFSVVHGVLLRPLPYPRPEGIVALWEESSRGGRMNFSDPNFEDVRDGARSFDGVAQYQSGVYSVAAGGESSRRTVAVVSADFFRIFGVAPERGRGFAPEDQRPGAPPTALVSHGFWERDLHGDPSLADARLTVDGKPVTLVGVLPAGFRFPDDAEIWGAREAFPRLPSRTAHNWRVVARLRAGVGLPAVRAELQTIAARLRQSLGEDTMMVGVVVAPLLDLLTGQVRSTLWVLLGAAVALLLIASANVVNMLLAQAATRSRELAVRTALGAGRSRLVRQLLTEALVLSLLAGSFGVVLAFWGVDALRALAPANLPRLDAVAVDRSVLSFALALSVALAGALGAIVAWRATSTDPQSALAEGGRGELALARTQRLGRVMIAGQVAATLVLLVGAGLLGRSLVRLLTLDAGFDRSQIVAVDLTLPDIDDDEGLARRVAFLSELTSRLRRLPGVREVGAANVLPLVGSVPDGLFVELGPGEPPPAAMADFQRLSKDKSRTGSAEYRAVDDGFFRALRVPLRRGRAFGERDTPESPHAALISESLARARWPGEDPLGRRLEFGNMDGDLRPLIVVGVVGDIRSDHLESAPQPTIYVNYRQRPQKTARFTMALRTEPAADPSPVMRAARETVRALDPTVPPRIRTFTDAVSASLGQRRFDLTLVGFFAGAALLLAMAGIYGVTAYWVALRTREIGVRMALGARGVDVVRMVLGQGLAPVALGVAVGALSAVALTRVLASMLFGVSALDPVTFGGVAVLLAAVAGLAGYLPARRATRVDPIVALRCE